MIAALERRGVTVIDDASRLDAGASVQTIRDGGGRLTMIYDSGSSSFLDVLHDSRHIAQIQRADLQGFDVFGSRRLKGFAERAAYGYEVRLGQRFGFSQEYMSYARGQMEFYFPPSYATKLSLSPSMAQQARVIEPGYGM